MSAATPDTAISDTLSKWLPPPALHTLQADAARADASGELQPGQIHTILDSPWLRMLAPRAVGGGELALPEVVRLEEALSHADGSCGWVVTLCAGAGWFAGFWPAALGQQIIGTPRLCLAGSGAPSGVAERDTHGWRLNGHWRHASGAPMATHFTFNARLQEGGLPLLDAQGQPRIAAFVVPATQVQVDADSWHSIGLRATASRAFTLTQGHAQPEQCFVLDAAHATDLGPLYRFGFRALAFVTLTACVLGMARHFLDLAQTPIARPLPPLGGPSAQAQALWSSSQQALQAARSDFYDALDLAWHGVAQGRPMHEAQETELVARSLALVRLAREGVDAVYPCCGLLAADPRTEINRVWRDLHTATQHTLWLR